MALVTETIQPVTPDGWVLIKTYSDAGMMIRQDETGELYEEAIDPQFAGRTYTETDIPVPQDTEEEETIAARAEAYDILMGEVT